MGTEWTEEQQNAISLRRRNLLVSAAAGAGKTAALVERIITMLTEDKPPLDVDRLLVVTFTKAAAAEMKERILDAIEKKLEENPEDTHLSLQETLINTAQISTVHSFCESVIRDHFSDIELDPAFRVGDDNEIELLRHQVLEELLEQKFADGEQDFLDFADAYGGKCGTKDIEDIILTVYDEARQNPNPEEWLESCVQAYEIDSVEELSRSRFARDIKDAVFRELDVCRELLEEGLDIIRSDHGPWKYEEAFLSDLDMIRRIRDAKTPEEFENLIQKPPFVTLNSHKKTEADVDQAKVKQAQNIRNKVKKRFKDIKDNYFSQDLSECLADMQAALPVVRELASLVSVFDRLYEEEKREQNLIDFSDMEHYALRILATETSPGVFTPTPAAREYQEQFVEVMVDEYQDINLMQETILTSVSRMDRGENNLFMVGDVKQSIYGFRASRPDLFLYKYDHYSKEDSEAQRINLRQNFRSRPQVIESVNALFAQMMHRDLGGIEYDDTAALHAGADYAEPSGEAQKDYDTEILILDGTKNAEMEARLIASKIRSLMGTLTVQDAQNKTMRPVRYGDIAILLRGTQELPGQIEKVFARQGIPLLDDAKEGYFDTLEIRLMLSYLQVLDNRQQDIPLTAVLTSPIGGLDEEDLARIRTAGKEKVPFYTAVEQYRTDGPDDETRKKLEACLGQMDHFQEMVPYTPVHELLWKILDETRYGDYVSAMPGGGQRMANLELLVDKARTFESNSYKGLFHFIRYIDEIRDEKMDFGEAGLMNEQADAVQVMTMHKSKGLEFPVVFVAGMGKSLKGGTRKNTGIYADSQYGIGIELRDLKQRVKSPTLIETWIRTEKDLQEKAEELRLLYVAFTRAREKLILVGNLNHTEESLEDYQYSLTYNKRMDARIRWDWILPAFLNCPPDTPISCTILTAEDIRSEEVQDQVSHRLDQAVLENWDTRTVYDPDVQKQLEEQFTYTYPYEDAKNQQMKFTVSELKKRTHMLDTMEDIPPEEELGDELFEEPDVVPLIPRFMQKGQEKLTGSDRGTAYHRVLELLDLTRAYDEDSLTAAVSALAAAGKISQDMADCIRPDDLLYFLQTESGKRMRAAAKRGQLYREQPFVLGVDSREIYPKAAEGDLTLVQGIIDVYFEEPDGLVVLDYKTDKVSAGRELVEKYHAQVEEYARALEQMLQKPVKEKIIYSFTLQEEIKL